MLNSCGLEGDYLPLMCKYKGFIFSIQITNNNNNSSSGYELISF